MGTATADERAAQLYAARRDRRPVAPFSEVDPSLTAADAYEIQRRFVARLLDDGGTVVGYKLGLTSKPMQELLGVHEPDYGPVLSSMVHDDGVVLAVADYLQPRIEAEIALVLDEPLRGPGVTTVQAARAVGGAVAALELVDSRIEDWRISLVDTIADLASSAAIVLGSRVVPLDGFDPRLVGMVIRRNGAVEATGAGAAALGNPVGAVAWLANTLAPFDVTLEAGHVIMTGSLHRAFPVAPGDRIRAEFDRLGPVGCRFR
jgi:2-keto-4-pentenoate hydratase